MPRLKFRHRMGLIVALAAISTLTVTLVTLLLHRQTQEELVGLETRYVPLIEVDRDLERLWIDLGRALEDAAATGEESKLVEADALHAEFLARLASGDQMIRDNGGDPTALAGAMRAYFPVAREVSAAMMRGAAESTLLERIDMMRRRKSDLDMRLDAATTPNRDRIAAAFTAARESQDQALLTTVLVAGSTLLVLAFLSWQITRRTVRALGAVSAGVERLASGNFAGDIDVTSNDELGDLAREANRTAARLREYRDRSEGEVWINFGLSGLAEEIAGQTKLEQIGAKALNHLAGYLGASAGFVWARDTSTDGLRLLATHGDAVAPEHEQLRLIRGVDVVGLRLSVALVHEGQTMGMLVFELPEPPAARAKDLLESARRVIGVAFQVAAARAHVDALLLAAETANKELESFSYSVSHDLRTPLRAIDGFSHALVEDEGEKLSESGHDYLKRIRTSAQRMGELIDDLLRLSRVSRGEFQRQRVDLSAMAQTVIGDLRRASPDREVEVVIQDRLHANADSRLIRIVLENLLGNAWKFTSKTPAARIELGARTDRGQIVYFVRDNGAGFDMQHTQRLFGAFQRLHSDREFPGTGIGLATVQRIVLRHGGTIWVEAAVGAGASFQFTLSSA